VFEQLKKKMLAKDLELQNIQGVHKLHNEEVQTFCTCNQNIEELHKQHMMMKKEMSDLKKHYSVL
jgi:hypothetical protein